VAGSRKVYSSADEPGLIYDTLAVSPSSAAARRDDWKKVIEVWYRIVDYIKDPATREEAIAIMASRVDLPAGEYKPFLTGTYILSPDEAMPIFKKTDGFKSIYGSSQIVDEFNVKHVVYSEPQDIDGYIDMSLSKEVLAK